MKRTAILFLALMAVGAHAQQGAPADVPRDHWAFKAVDSLFREGLLKGYPDGTFKGSRPATRYELAGVLDNLNQRFQSRLTALRLPNDFQNAELAELETRIGVLRSEVATLKSNLGEVDDLTKKMASLHEQLAKIRGNLGEMRQKLPKK